MKRIILFVLGLCSWISVYSQNDRDLISSVIEKNFLNKIGDTLIVDVFNKKYKHHIVLESINVMFIDTTYIIDEYYNKNNYSYKQIKSIEELKNINQYKLIYLNFKNINKNISYQTQLIINNENSSPEFEIYYNIKSNSGEIKKVNYLRIFFR